MTTSLDYLGTELEVFSHAKNWKAYWSTAITPYLGQAIVDIGAGIGATAETLNKRYVERWVELEPDETLVQQIREAQNSGKIPKHYEIVQGLSRDLVGEEQFDTALYIDVLEHIEDDKDELVNASRLLLPGGHIVVVAPAHNYLYTAFDKQIGHFRRYNKQMLKDITPEGFDIVELFYLDSVGMLASLSNRLFLKSGSPTVGQIKIWDRLMVPASRCIDLIVGRRLGKSIVYIIRKKI